MDLLGSIIAPFKQDPNTLSIVLTGSSVRGEMDAYSDLDIHVVVRGKRPPDQMLVLENRLVNINVMDAENRESMLTDPWKAMANIAAARDARILFDPDGWYASLQERAKRFSWQTVAKDAAVAISWVLAENAEIAQKVLGGLTTGNHEKALYATVVLLTRLTDVAALANGVLSNSENRLWSTVRDAEPDTIWKNLFWVALGFNAETVTARAEAALSLYSRSVTLYQTKLLPEHLQVIQHAYRLIEARAATDGSQ